MTTIIGEKKLDGTLRIHGDKRTSYSNWIYEDGVRKIFKVSFNWNETLIARCGDSLNKSLFLEIIDSFKKENPDSRLDNNFEAIKFFNHIKENSNINDCEVWLIVMNHNIQLQINAAWQIDESKNWYLYLGSWYNIMLTFMKTIDNLKIDFEIEDIYDIISSLDYSTSREFDTLELLPDIIQTN